MSPTELPIPMGSVTQQAVAVPDWLEKNAGEVLGGAVSVVLIVIVAVIVRTMANRAIKRLVQRTLQPAEEGRRPRPNGRGATVLQRDSTRSRERREQRAKTLGTVLSSIVTVAVGIMAAAMVLGEVGIALGPLLASAGVVGLAIGFGAQSLVADYLSGLLIMIEDQYGVGDTVDLGEAVGEVEHVGLRLTQVRDLHGGLWHIRNGEILRVKNDSQDWARAVLDVGVAYDADLDAVHRILEDTGRKLRLDPEHGEVLLEDPVVWGVQSLDADRVTVRIVVKTLPLKQWSITRQLRRRVKDALDEAGIEMPFPQRTVWMRHDDPGTADPDADGRLTGIGRQRGK